ncbi:MAG: 3-dehydroquinate synthase [Corallococcus sp.]|nr:3-dehydroquinate synthase [Corallococcus sp.]MCM1360048.1 3-dehydroquinate synthase [Corallococcus sp.]MCM1395605.1 3-dehydroquinate synthase [Corallococcus sp.]
MITYKKFHVEKYSDSLIVTDVNLSEMYGFKGENVFVLSAGEDAKTFDCARQLCEWFLQKSLQKDGTVVAVGGGSVGDVAGFAASVYKRGVKLLHVPTTLLAQIDSSIGGKTAINVGSVKNAVGTFYQADTLIDASFLDTLPNNEWNNGLGELLKYRMLSEDIDETYLKGDMGITVEICSDYKQQICSRDPFDGNLRKLLNFGHTIGHAMELNCGIPHGEAVANGLYYETALAQKLGLCGKKYANKWQNEITQLFAVRPLTRDILAATVHDKKNSDGLICCVLPTEDDNFVLRNFTLQQLEEALLSDR